MVYNLTGLQLVWVACANAALLILTRLFSIDNLCVSDETTVKSNCLCSKQEVGSIKKMGGQ